MNVIFIWRLKISKILGLDKFDAIYFLLKASLKTMKTTIRISNATPTLYIFLKKVISW